MALTELLDHIAHDPDCIVLPATGHPNIGPVHVMPEDVRAFYDLCGGLVIARGSSREVRIVGPHECVLANDVFLSDLYMGDLAETAREELRGHVSWDWYIVADLWNGDFLVCDFGHAHTGRCYEALWEEYPYRMPIVSCSFSAFLEQQYETKGQHWYWGGSGFQPLGDANDAV